MDNAGVERKLVERSIKETHASTHTSYSMEVLDVFKLDKHQEDEKVDIICFPRQILLFLFFFVFLFLYKYCYFWFNSFVCINEERYQELLLNIFLS